MKLLIFAALIAVALAVDLPDATKDLPKPVELTANETPEPVPEKPAPEAENLEISGRSFPSFPQRYNYDKYGRYQQKYNPYAYRPYDNRYYKPNPEKPEYVTSYIEANADILKSVSEIGTDGFNYEYETRQGIAAEAHGVLKQIGNNEAIVIRGSYRYTAPNGRPVVVTYIADENGYQPHGDLIPQVDGVARYSAQKSADV